MNIRVEGLSATDAHAALSAAFEEIALIHRLMSFHQPGSDIGRLNREGSIRLVPVNPHTLNVLTQALQLSAETGGCFDVTVAAELVRWGWLPSPNNDAKLPRGTWQDIEIHPDGSVGFRRPVWIDLGGIAKGYAVDRAVKCLAARGATRAVVNAGGDIRVLGHEPEVIALRVDSESNVEGVPVLELADGSIASSSGHRQRQIANIALGPHVDGRNRTLLPPDRFVCVLAKNCMIADALTKIVMVKGAVSASFLGQFGALAYLFDGDAGWQSLNGELQCA